MKQVQTLFLVIILLCGGLFSYVTLTRAEEDKKVYVALGDSIAYGYGLSDTDMGFVAQVGAALEATVINLSVNGMNSTEFLVALQNEEVQTAIQQADILTLSIGSNDLLRPFTEMIMTALGPSLQNPSSLNELSQMIQKFSELTEILNDAETVAVFQAQIAQFEKNWVQLISKIKQLAPKAQLVVNNFYNPFVHTSFIGVPFGAYTEKYIPQLNAIVQKHQSLGYLIVDVYTPFQQVGLTNVDAAKFSFDPHPNQKGHNMIADLVKQALGLSVMPSIDPDDSIKKIKTVLNGKTRIFEQKSLRMNDQYNYVSADEFAEIIGAKIIISKNLQTVVITKGTEKLEGKIGEKRAKINGNTVTLSMPIKFQDTHLLVPIEGLTITFGGSYKYDQQTNTLKVRIEL